MIFSFSSAFFHTIAVISLDLCRRRLFYIKPKRLFMYPTLFSGVTWCLWRTASVEILFAQWTFIFLALDTNLTSYFLNVFDRFNCSFFAIIVYYLHVAIKVSSIYWFIAAIPIPKGSLYLCMYNMCSLPKRFAPAESSSFTITYSVSILLPSCSRIQCGNGK